MIIKKTRLLGVEVRGNRLRKIVRCKSPDAREKGMMRSKCGPSIDQTKPQSRVMITVNLLDRQLPHRYRSARKSDIKQARAQGHQANRGELKSESLSAVIKQRENRNKRKREKATIKKERD